MRHAGKILLNEKTIASALGFSGGIIRHIGPAEDHLGVAIVIEHRDMPDVPDGGMIQIVDPEIFTISPGYWIRTQPRPRRWISVLFNAIKVAMVYIKLAKGGV